MKKRSGERCASRNCPGLASHYRNVSGMALRIVLSCLCLSFGCPSTFALITQPPKGGVEFVSTERRDRLFIMIDPVNGPAKEITEVPGSGGRIPAGVPPRVSGLYELPSVKLIYSLDGWSHLDRPRYGDLEMRFVIREVWNSPKNGIIQATKPNDEGQWPPGLALYDRGKLVRYFYAEEIWKAYTDIECFEVSTISYPVDYDFDDAATSWTIRTQPRGPSFLFGQPPWYSEKWVFNARTGEVISFRAVDWLLWASSALVALLTAGIWFLVRRRMRMVRGASN